MGSSAAVGPSPHHGDDIDRVVVIAASAGGIQALLFVLSALPADFPAPVLILQHHRPGRPGLLVRVLQRDSRLPVKDAMPGERLERGVVYVAPADRHMRISDQRLLVMGNHGKVNFVKSSADPLFRSAAETFGARAIGVVLSGMGRNGAAGAKAIRDAGGVVIAQDRSTSQFFGMPSAAIEAGAVTRVLPLDRIATSLVALVGQANVR